MILCFLSLLFLLSLSACGNSRKDSFVVDINQIISYDSFEAFEAGERKEPDGLTAYYVPPVTDDGWRPAKISQRRGTYVSILYRRTAEQEIPSYLPELEREQLQSLSLTEYLYYSNADGLAQFIASGFQEMVIGGRTFYVSKAYSMPSVYGDTEHQPVLTGYEIAVSFDGKLFYMHLPPDDNLENMIRYLDLVKKEIR